MRGRRLHRIGHALIQLLPDGIWSADVLSALLVRLNSTGEAGRSADR